MSIITYVHGLNQLIFERIPSFQVLVKELGGCSVYVSLSLSLSLRGRLQLEVGTLVCL